MLLMVIGGQPKHSLKKWKVRSPLRSHLPFSERVAPTLTGMAQVDPHQNSSRLQEHNSRTVKT